MPKPNTQRALTIPHFTLRTVSNQTSKFRYLGKILAIETEIIKKLQCQKNEFSLNLSQLNHIRAISVLSVRFFF